MCVCSSVLISEPNFGWRVPRVTTTLSYLSPFEVLILIYNSLNPINTYTVLLPLNLMFTQSTWSTLLYQLILHTMFMLWLCVSHRNLVVCLYAHTHSSISLHPVRFTSTNCPSYWSNCSGKMDHYFAPSHTFLWFFKNVAKFMEAYCTLGVDLRLNAWFLTSNQTVSPLGNGQPGYCRIWQYSIFKETPIDLWTSLVAQLVKNLPAMRGTRVWSPDWEDPLEKGTATHSSILVWWIPWMV